MLTISRHFNGTRRDFAADCDVCGVKWHRSEMVRNGDGLLVCPDDREGKTATELGYEEMIAAADPSPLIRGRE
jgi:hypothetical protein